MIWRGVVTMAVALLSATAVAESVVAAAPEGPRLALMKLDSRPERLELLSVDPAGALPLRIAGGGRRARPLPYPFASPAWSPNGSELVFSGFVAAESERRRLFVVAADGSNLRQVPGTAGALDSVFSPDGHTIAFARIRERSRQNENGGEDVVYRSASVWLADLDGGKPRRITPWRNRLRQFPSSFSPDGSILAITRLAGDKAPEAIGLSFDGTASSLLAHNAFEPVFSPDGSRIAFLRGPTRTFDKPDGTTRVTLTDLYTMRFGGGGLERLTRTPRGVELAPRWDPSGQRLVYTELEPLKSDAAFLGFGDSIAEINADGSCRIEVLSQPNVIFFGATWQPGPGREAGRIDC